MILIKLIYEDDILEDFIDDIYKKSYVIEGLQEYILLTDSCRYLEARSKYNITASMLEYLIQEIATQNISLATQIQSIALEIKDNFDDYCLSKGIVSSRLIPLLENYINAYSTIQVSEGHYTLKSSYVGFLTIRDNRSGRYLHDVYSPMLEAYRTATTVYKPEIDTYLIFGCGLGYLAYQIYNISKGSTEIWIYEDDEAIIKYAYHYGVLSLIPDDVLSLIHNPDLDALTTVFLNDINEMNATSFFFSPWKKSICDNLHNNELNRLIINWEFDLQTAGWATVNYRKNKKLPHVSFNDISNFYSFNEWIIVSAGPSLDENISFLCDCKKEHKGIIAVNTVLRRLTNEGITPNLVVAADQSDNLRGHIEGITELYRNVPLVADWVLSWKYANAYKGPICFVRTNASSDLTKDHFPDEPVWDISGTVTCLAIEAAVRLGAEKIYLVGQDLAYPGGQKYAKYMPHEEAPNAKWEMQVPSVDGGMVDTCEAFDWFRKAIEYQIAKYDHVKFINLSKHGAMIKGAFTDT